MSCYDGDWAGTLATTSHSALGCEASGGCELRGDARGERVLSATRRTDCARRRPPSSPHAEYRRAYRRALGRTYITSGASSEARRRHRIGSCHVPPCDNAQQHVQLMELASAITAFSRPMKTARCFAVLPAIAAGSLGCSPAVRIAPNASTTRSRYAPMSGSARPRCGASRPSRLRRARRGRRGGAGTVRGGGEGGGGARRGRHSGGALLSTALDDLLRGCTGYPDYTVLQ